MEKLEYIFDTSFLSAYDGDSLTLLDNVGHDIQVKSKVRLKGVDTPELRGGTPLTKEAAKVVRDYVTRWCEGAALVSVSLRGDKDKYGRYLVEIYKDGIQLNNHLVAIGFARSYFGEKREAWTDKEAQRIIDSLFNSTAKNKNN